MLLAITLVVPYGKESALGLTRDSAPTAPWVGSVSLLSWKGALRSPAIGGPDVEDIPRVAVGVLRAPYDVVNYAVEGSRLAAAHVPQ